MRDHRKLYELLGLGEKATPDEVKRAADKKRGGLVGEGLRWHFEKEARVVLGDAVLRHHYAATGAGYVLCDKRLADADDAWLRELQETKKSHKPVKTAGHGLLGGAMGWLGIGRSDAPKDTASSLAESIKELLSSIGAQFDKAQQEGGMSSDAISETNALLKELVSQCSEDPKVALSVVGDMGVAMHIAKLINNPADDLDMKIWSSAVITLMSLNEKGQREAITAKPDSSVPGILDLYMEYIGNHATYFISLALLGGDVDLSAVEYQRSICGNILLTLARISEDPEGCEQLAQGDLAQQLVVFLCSNTPMLSATQVLNVCTTLHHLAKYSERCAQQIQPHLPVLVSLLSALSGKLSPKLPQVAQAVEHLAATIHATATPEHSPVTELFIKTLAQAASVKGASTSPHADIGFLKQHLVGALKKSAASADDARAVKVSVKDKVWEHLVTAVVACISLPDARDVFRGWVEQRVITGVESVSKRPVVAILVDELCGGAPETVDSAVQILGLIFSIGANEEAFKKGFATVAQAVVDKLSQVLGGPQGPRVVDVLHSCIEHATQLQASLVPHILNLLRSNEGDSVLLTRCASCLVLLSTRITTVDKIGNESQKYLVQILLSSETPEEPSRDICDTFANWHRLGASLLVLKESLGSLKESQVSSVQELVSLIEVKKEPAEGKKTEPGAAKKVSKGEKSAADVEKKETRARHTIVSEEAQARNPYAQKFDTERKKIQQRAAHREERDRQEGIRLQKELEMKNLMRLRKKTATIEQGEEAKRQGIEKLESEDAKKLYTDGDKALKGLVKRLKDEADSAAALARAKEEAARKAEEERLEEHRRQEIIREHNERMEEERHAANPKTRRSSTPTATRPSRGLSSA
eukprot:TRINITY_DN11590_c0_g1_i1.p1 TRINITY_DN11590_c0_g1~~TRINITY_DN11590_c0_g1_i1.p1  ORF type:complete len:873 (+),score=330.90 TRINITY_DN11590_c0_g1_i1:72-2690(+)